MEEGYISFKWDRHDGHLNYLLSNICNKEIFSDATLACDGCLFPVHKLVLAACSDYFCEIFDRVPCKNPVIVLKDTSSSDLVSLLEYMYLGSVSVKQVDLNQFIQVAESLKIKGLAVSDDLLNPLPILSKKVEVSPKSNRKQNPRKTLKKVNGIDKNINNAISKPSAVKHENCNDEMDNNQDSSNNLKENKENTQSCIREYSPKRKDSEDAGTLEFDSKKIKIESQSEEDTTSKDDQTEDEHEAAEFEEKYELPATAEIKQPKEEPVEEMKLFEMEEQDDFKYKSEMSDRDDADVGEEVPQRDVLSKNSQGQLQCHLKHAKTMREFILPPLPEFTSDVTPYLKGEPLTMPQKQTMRESLINQLIDFLEKHQLLMSSSKGQQVWGYRIVAKALLDAYPSMIKECSLGKYQKRHPIGFFISKLAEKRRNIRKKMLSQANPQ